MKELALAVLLLALSISGANAEPPAVASSVLGRTWTAPDYRQVPPRYDGPNSSGNEYPPDRAQAPIGGRTYDQETCRRMQQGQDPRREYKEDYYNRRNSEHQNRSYYDRFSQPDR